MAAALVSLETKMKSSVSIYSLAISYRWSDGDRVNAPLHRGYYRVKVSRGCISTLSPLVVNVNDKIVQFASAFPYSMLLEKRTEPV